MQNKKEAGDFSNLIRLAAALDNSTVKEIAKFGYEKMRKEKLYPHFFLGHSLKKVALYLTFFSLNLPYDFKNPTFLEKRLGQEEIVPILKLFERRIKERIPTEYITEEAFYSGHRFYVNQDVLVPRSLMNTQFKKFLAMVDWHNYKVLDLCTGSGCIGITIALENEKLQVDLADISEKALLVAKENIKRFNLSTRVRCIQSDLFENITDKYDLIVTNPPYVSCGEYERQPIEIKHEPKLALLGGKDGLDIIEKILHEAKTYLNPNGLLIAEVGYSAAKLLKKKYPKFGWFKYVSKHTVWGCLDRIIERLGLLDSILIYRAKDISSKRLTNLYTLMILSTFYNCIYDSILAFMILYLHL